MAVFAVRAQVASKQCSVLVSHQVSDKTMATHVSVRFPLLHVRPWPRYHIAPAIQPLWAAIFAIFLLLTERGYCGTRHPIPGAVAFLANARARCCDAACILKHIFMCFSSFAACSQSQILPEQCQPGVPRNCSLLQRYGRKTRFIQESRILLATTKCTTRRSGAKMAAMSLAPTLQF